jgi:hypothetical protein
MGREIADEREQLGRIDGLRSKAAREDAVMRPRA